MATQTVLYGNYSFQYTQLTTRQQAIIATDGIQHEMTRYTFDVRALVSGTNHVDVLQKICTMRRELSKPRQAFKVSWYDEAGTETIFYTFDSTNDDAWGPFPGDFRLVRWAGGYCAIVEWSVTVSTKECMTEHPDYCPSGASAHTNAEILSLVTQWNHSIDAGGLTTRTKTGVLTIASWVIQQKNKTADSYRNYCCPTVPAGFHVTSQQYSCSEDGRQLRFSVTMQEKVYTLPWPLFAGDASWSVKIENQGLIATFSLTGRFEAARSVSKDQIINRIFALLNSKLEAATTAPSVPQVLQSEIGTPEIYGRNVVSFSFSGIFGLGDVNASGSFPAIYNHMLDSVVVEPPSSQGLPFLPGTYGGLTVDQGVQADLPFSGDACSANYSQAQNTTAETDGPTTSVTGTGATVGGVTAGGATVGSTSIDHLTNPMVAYHEEYHYCLDNGIEVYYPKTADGVPYAQQIRQPSLTIIQAGYCTQYGVSPASNTTITIPPPPMSAGIVVSADVIPSSPEPIGDGSTNQWTTHWRYVIKSTATFDWTNTSDVMFPRHPIDQRRTGQSPEPVDNLQLQTTIT